RTPPSVPRGGRTGPRGHRRGADRRRCPRPRSRAATTARRPQDRSADRLRAPALRRARYARSKSPLGDVPSPGESESVPGEFAITLTPDQTVRNGSEPPKPVQTRQARHLGPSPTVVEAL